MGSHTIAAGPSPGATAGLLCALALIVAAASVFAGLAQRLRQPAVVGEIVAGVVLGPSVLGLLPGDVVDVVFPPEVMPYLQVLSQLGLVLFMFGVGYEFDAARLRRHGRQVTAVSLTSVALPFALGAALAVALVPWFDRTQMRTDGVLVPALFLGAAMSITAFPVLARIIGERGLQKDRVGVISVACAAIQDVLAWIVLAVVVALAGSTGPWPLVRMALACVALLAALVWLVRPALAWALAPARPWSGALVTHAVLVVGLLLSAWATEAMGLHAVFGAFAFGTVAPRAEVDAAAPEVPERIEQASLLLLPAFFVVTGLSVDLGGLGGHGVLILVAVLVVACAGKFLGAAGAAGLTGANRRDAAVLGVLMNARGLTELVILNVGLGLGVLDGQLFTAMVTMAIVTTVMTGPLLDRFHRPAVPAPRPSEPASRAADDRRPLVVSPDETR
ncbi:cation:proton antiporter [Streptomyces sp. NPDC051041]|uniref:cation:proton antiporter n=1 Tax=Streptomyces sp. NPDC051041 TaxID=3365640 RepID=UPI0037AA2557